MIIGGSFTINGVNFNYGAFLSAVINFVIMAFVLFLLVKGMNTLMDLGHKKKKDEPEPEPEPDPQLVLLTEIRDLLKTDGGAEKVKEMLDEKDESAEVTE